MSTKICMCAGANGYFTYAHTSTTLHIMYSLIFIIIRGHDLINYLFTYLFITFNSTICTGIVKKFKLTFSSHIYLLINVIYVFIFYSTFS